MREKLAMLYSLQQQDTALDGLKKRYGQLNKGESQKAALAAAIAADKEAEAAVGVARVAAADTEMEQKAVEEKRVEYETRLYSGAVTIPKELQAIQAEVEMLTRNRDRLGEKVQSLLVELEDCTARRKQAQQERKQAQEASSTAVAAYKSESASIVADARRLVAERAETAGRIDPKLLARYEAVRKNTGGIAVVPVEDSNSCGGCKMGLPNSLVKRLQVGSEIETCDNCGRILILQ